MKAQGMTTSSLRTRISTKSRRISRACDMPNCVYISSFFLDIWCLLPCYWWIQVLQSLRPLGLLVIFNRTHAYFGLCIKVYGWWIWCNNSELPFNLPNYLGFIFFLIFCQFDGVVDEVFNLELLFYIVNLMLVAIEFLWYIVFLGVIDQCYLEEKILWTIRFLEVFCGVPSGCVLLVDSISQRELFTPGEFRQKKNWVCYGLFRVLHQSRISLLFKATLPHWKQRRIPFYFIFFQFSIPEIRLEGLVNFLVLFLHRTCFLF